MIVDQYWNAVTFDNCTSWSLIKVIPSSLLISCNTTRVHMEIKLVIL